MAEQRMTEAQAWATHPELTAWVGASAGTGKTHVLTARVLRLMLTGTRPENIICLTFTKAAAAEMTNRIFAELGSWTLMSDEKLASEIRRRTEELPDEEMLTRARQLFAEVLDLSPGLQIQTFHSFCQSLLGRFPLEAGMAPGFDGVDESEARDLMASAKDEMLSSTRKATMKPLARALSHVAKLVTENTFDEVIDRLSYDAAMLARAETAYGGPDGVASALYRALGLTPGDTEDRVLIAAMPDKAFDVSGVRALAGAMAGGSKKEKEGAAALHAFLAADETERLDLISAYTLVFLTTKNAARARVANKGTVEADPGLFDIIEAEQQRMQHIAEHRMRIKAAAATAALLQLGLAQLAGYRRLKAERGLVDFDDMIERTVLLFQQADAAPWVLFKLDSAVEHILVDEAQDTNRDQWRVVEALSSEFFTGAGASDKTRTLFAVGDAKQSIFSFQRADPKEFIAARDRVFRRAHEAGLPAEAVPLNQSFRSGEAVLSLVDAVFDADATAWRGLSPDGEIVRHDYSRKGHAGLVELWPLEVPEDKADDDAAEWEMPLLQESVDDAEQRTAWRIARRISQMLMRDEELTSKGRPIRAGDILVLVRRRTAFVDHLVRALKSLAVPVAGRDRMVLADELAVMDLMVLARFALQPTDDLSLATVLKGPFFGLDDEALFELAYGRKGTLWQSLDAKAGDIRFAAAASMLKDLLRIIDVKTPFEFLSYVLTDRGGRKQLVARLGSEIHDPVDEFIEEALRFELSGTASMQAFVHSVDRGGLQIKRDLEAAGDNVRIMTAHSAKGLQAPIVFLSDLVGLPNTIRETRILPIESATEGLPPLPFWTSPAKDLPFTTAMKDEVKERQLAEYRRLLYVAMTRSEDRLYVAGWQAKGEPDPNCWANAIAEGFERIGAEHLMSGDIEVSRFTIRQTADVTDEIRAQKQADKPENPAWLFAELPDEPSPMKPLMPSRPDEEPAVSSPLVRSDAKRFQRGRYIHAMLQWMPEIPIGLREAAAMRYLGGAAKELDPTQCTQLWQEVSSVLTQAPFAELFGPDSQAEVPITGIVSNRAVSGQVDRLIVTSTDVQIVDYKTNRPPPRDASGVQDIYLRQMGLYTRILEVIYPDKTIRACLLWTDAGRLMELPKTLMNEALTRAGL
ncbi:MAG: double-strand break repair helicase AddA [Kordiimonadales bacterium]|nr:MAG: double-strand break repair helicase AddA [Kordiimonadales bacterium]